MAWNGKMPCGPASPSICVDKEKKRQNKSLPAVSETAS